MANRSISTTGVTEMLEQLQVADKRAVGIATGAVFEGARVVADALTASVATIQTEKWHYADNGETRLPSPQEKAALQHASFGIAHFSTTPVEVNTSVGLNNAGYVYIQGSGKTPRRVAVAELARSIESGTSFMQKQPFMRKAVNACKGAAQSAMEKAAAARLEQLFK